MFMWQRKLLLLLQNVATILMEQKQRREASGLDLSKDFGLVETTTTLTIANELCGIIIGKAGMNIRYIKQVCVLTFIGKKCVGTNLIDLYFWGFPPPQGQFSKFHCPPSPPPPLVGGSKLCVVYYLIDNGCV